MKVTEYICDDIEHASKDLEILLNDGYEVLTSQIMTLDDDDHVWYVAMLVKEEC